MGFSAAHVWAWIKHHKVPVIIVGSLAFIVITVMLFFCFTMCCRQPSRSKDRRYPPQRMLPPTSDDLFATLDRDHDPLRQRSDSVKKLRDDFGGGGESIAPSSSFKSTSRFDFVNAAQPSLPPMPPPPVLPTARPQPPRGAPAHADSYRDDLPPDAIMRDDYRHGHSAIDSEDAYILDYPHQGMPHAVSQHPMARQPSLGSLRRDYGRQGMPMQPLIPMQPPIPMQPLPNHLAPESYVLAPERAASPRPAENYTNDFEYDRYYAPSPMPPPPEQYLPPGAGPRMRTPKPWEPPRHEQYHPAPQEQYHLAPQDRFQQPQPQTRHKNAPIDRSRERNHQSPAQLSPPSADKYAYHSNRSSDNNEDLGSLGGANLRIANPES
ncbi:uncharacterized protein L969DRAFT_19731 [Mixia osmundae IAM 14324]|uniref:Uncharacterized protein n=1 Tax=Mixia osmundae (strain CBS 9802 / IAM 14324 / JCM 22182 / KY 12970) TaxID=764103 RepID=G7DZM4_MIXOS|nr:uncharacterized protein L969DRAFT_19731 [Mixia osmundae IAM 14324]KEI37196.1 hypothetical protein L969DRAFT_19731 [Mixia osmundae IAM 14324]GAA96034.1 hypothetical protein E5Q_02694 [Mixia osmundae IAM 14324]